MLDLRSEAFKERLETYKQKHQQFMELSDESTHRRLTPKEQRRYRALRRYFAKLIRSKKRDDKPFLDLANKVSNIRL